MVIRILKEVFGIKSSPNQGTLPLSPLPVTHRMDSSSLITTTPISTSDRLINASRDGDIQTVRQILETGFNPNQAVRYFGYSGQEKGAMVFHSGDGVYCMNAVQAAVVGGHNDVLHALITARAGVSSESIVRAGADGNLTALKLMVEPYLKERPDWQHPEHCLTDALMATCRRGNQDAAAFLLDHGALIEGYSGAYNSGNPLCAAISSGNIDLVKDLVTRGANVNAHGIHTELGFPSSDPEIVAYMQSVRTERSTEQPAVGSRERYESIREQLVGRAERLESSGSGDSARAALARAALNDLRKRGNTGAPPADEGRERERTPSRRRDRGWELER